MQKFSLGKDYKHKKPKFETRLAYLDHEHTHLTRIYSRQANKVGSRGKANTIERKIFVYY